MQVNIREQIGQGIGFFAAFALALFVPAGTVAWPAGWIFLILFFGFYARAATLACAPQPGVAARAITSVAG
ncbi:MAG: hypothetical protein R2867_04470 [Caldilineaceae bacterium]